MKTNIFATLLFVLLTHTLYALPTVVNLSDIAVSDAPGFAEGAAGKGSDPVDIKVVVSQKRIWLIADEMPMKCLKTQIKNAEGKIVLEKCFSSKCTDWFLNIEALPKGEYTLLLGTDYIEKFKK